MASRDASPARCPGGEEADLSDAKLELVYMLEGLIFDSSPFCGHKVSKHTQAEKLLPLVLVCTF